MGWGDCGEDKNGRPIGYVYPATCDNDHCNKEIDRGLSYVCGGMHGEDEYSCDKYFCSDHLSNYIETDGGSTVRICDECKRSLIDSGEWIYDDNEGCLTRIKE